MGCWGYPAALPNPSLLLTPQQSRCMWCVKSGQIHESLRMGVASSGLPRGFLAPAQLTSSSRLGSNGGHRHWQLGLQEGWEGQAGESDHPPWTGTKGPEFPGRQEAQAQLQGSRIRMEGNDSQNSKWPLGQGKA